MGCRNGDLLRYWKQRSNFFKWAILGLFLIYFWTFSNKQPNFFNKLTRQNVHTGFELTNFNCESPPLTTRPALPSVTVLTNYQI